MAGYKAGPDAPPHGEPDERARASLKSGDRKTAAAFRSRLGGTGVYKTQGDTGKSGRVLAPAAIEPLVLNPGARGAKGPKSFKPMKT